MVDDHAIDSLNTWFQLSYDELRSEWLSGSYSKLSDCPSYEETRAYRDAMNIMIKSRYGPDFEEYKIKPLMHRLNEEIRINEFWNGK
ncbi:hypothetical protein ACTWQB_09440 [Piscibacillus sp. B03]|uniref:hypothetical protein n=1 Tax=Piscibacillus sp. B03 TaxID=3457430 RepID=UPI003FCE0A22